MTPSTPTCKTRRLREIRDRQDPLCPSCGRFVYQLIEETGFCRACTNEHERGGPHEPDYHKPRTT